MAEADQQKGNEEQYPENVHEVEEAEVDSFEVHKVEWGAGLKVGSK